LFHVAADYLLWVPNPAIMYDINVNGTEVMILAGAEAGMSRMVYINSVATLGLNSNGLTADEETTSNLGPIIGHYKRSKFLAEQAVQNSCVNISYHWS
jgi:dihydroflavonol-4-reductase